MISEQKTAEQKASEPTPNYEYLQVRGTVSNFTKERMIVTGSNLDWGKWIQSPVDTPAQGTSYFASQGRDSSPSGTEGWATWKIGHAVIRVTFSCPLHGSNQQSITCHPPGAYRVSTQGTTGNVNQVTYTIYPA